MTTPKKDVLEVLKVLAKKGFQTLTPPETDGDRCSAAIAIDTYAELHLLILNLLKVAVATLDATHHNVTNVDGACFAVKSVLELAMQLLPLEEAYLLDEIYGMMREE